jgi:hypothetical protein
MRLPLPIFGRAAPERAASSARPANLERFWIRFFPAQAQDGRLREI